MITTKIITIRTRQYQKTKSDSCLIRQIETGNEYREAVDVLPCKYTYEETDVPLADEELTDSEALAILTGGSV